MKYLLAISIFIAGCEANQDRVDKFDYIKDNRTGFCFATYYLGSSVGLLSNVPCTPEVERLIQGGGK